MKKYIGTKIIEAAPAWRITAMDGRMFIQRKDDASDYAGVVEDGYVLVYEDGYESWSPKRVFEEAYRQTTGMSFGLAIEAAKKGKRIARLGWNGQNMSVAYQKGYPQGIPCNANTANAWGMEEGELFRCRPYLQMRCADGTFQMWVASQTDILEDDWYIVDDVLPI